MESRKSSSGSVSAVEAEDAEKMKMEVHDSVPDLALGLARCFPDTVLDSSPDLESDLVPCLCAVP